MRFEDLSDPEHDAAHPWVLIMADPLCPEGQVFRRFATLEEAEVERKQQQEHEDNQDLPGLASFRVEYRPA